jgi:hypothetical protein
MIILTPLNYNAMVIHVNRITAHDIDINTILIRILHMFQIFCVIEPPLRYDPKPYPGERAAFDLLLYYLISPL